MNLTHESGETMELAGQSAAGFTDMVEPVAEKQFSDVTIQDFDYQIEELDAQIKPIKAQRDNLSNWLIACFKEHNRSSYRSAYGLLVVSKRYSVTVPKGAARDKFRAYLEEKGSFDTLWSVNSQTLSSWHKKEMEAAAVAGDINFTVPGISDPIYRNILSLRKR